MSYKRDFPYNVISLIELVEERTCLWDKEDAEYRNKVYKHNAWKEICILLDSDFDTISESKQNGILEIVQNKWYNIRDAFVRSLRACSMKECKKPYVYYDNLKFLLKCTKNYDAELVDIKFVDTDDINSRSLTPELPKCTIKTEDCNKRKSEESDYFIEAIEEISQQRLPSIDEDEAFILSVLPAVKRIHRDRKLDFRMDVLSLLKEYTRKKTEKKDDGV